MVQDCQGIKIKPLLIRPASHLNWYSELAMYTVAPLVSMIELNILCTCTCSDKHETPHLAGCDYSIVREFAVPSQSIRSDHKHMGRGSFRRSCCSRQAGAQIGAPESRTGAVVLLALDFMLFVYLVRTIIANRSLQ